METITIKTQKTVEVEKVVQLPIYRKGICHAYKVFSPEKCIQVTWDSDVNIAIVVAHAGLAWQGKTEQDCTEEEFEELFYATSAKLIALTVGKKSEVA